MIRVFHGRSEKAPDPRSLFHENIRESVWYWREGNIWGLEFWGNQWMGVNCFQTLKVVGILLIPHWQTILFNVIKRLFSWKTIEFGYIKYEAGGRRGVWNVLCTRGAGFLCACKGGLLFIFELSTKSSRPPTSFKQPLPKHTKFLDWCFSWLKTLWKAIHDQNPR